MEQPTVSTPDQLRDAAATAIAPDPGTADLLARYAKGEKLTPQENGKLSWVGRKFPWLAQKFGVTPKPAQPGAAPGGPAAVGAGEPAEAAGDGLGPVEIDSGFAERTTTAVLRRADSIAQRVIGNAAREAGAAPELVARFERAAAMSSADKEVISETIPACFQASGADLRKYPFWVLGGVLGMYATDLTLLVMELREMKKEKLAKEAERAPTPAAAGQDSAPPVALPDPPRPAGAPPVLNAS